MSRKYRIRGSLCRSCNFCLDIDVAQTPGPRWPRNRSLWSSARAPWARSPLCTPHNGDTKSRFTSCGPVSQSLLSDRSPTGDRHPDGRAEVACPSRGLELSTNTLGQPSGLPCVSAESLAAAERGRLHPLPWCLLQLLATLNGRADANQPMSQIFGTPRPSCSTSRGPSTSHSQSAASTPCAMPASPDCWIM